MKIQLITELAEDVLVQGLGLQLMEDGHYSGRLGRHEVRLVHLDEIDSSPVDNQILLISSTKNDEGHYRPGDFLIAGSDELVDRAFSALDDLEQRGLVVNLTGEQPQTDVNEKVISKIQEWKNQKIPFLCLFLAEPFAEEQAKVASFIRKVVS